MDLFSLVNNKVETTPECKLIQEFSTLSEKELGYVYFMEDYKSPYNAYPVEERETIIKEDLGLKEISNKMLLAQKKYSDLQETTSMRLLKSARLAITKLSDFFEREGPKSRNYVTNLGNIGKLIESLDRLESKVKKEVSIEGRSKGGRSINKFEE
jgi:hypothetical protein